MPTWVAPVVVDVPPVLPETRGASYRLMRHFGSNPRGQNVYILSTDVVTTIDPGTAPDSGSPYVRLVLFGGHVGQTVSDADAAILTAAGYGANLS